MGTKRLTLYWWLAYNCEKSVSLVEKEATAEDNIKEVKVAWYIEEGGLNTNKKSIFNPDDCDCVGGQLDSWRLCSPSPGANSGTSPGFGTSTCPGASICARPGTSTCARARARARPKAYPIVPFFGTDT
jgi:hypothetical protein